MLMPQILLSLNWYVDDISKDCVEGKDLLLESK